MGHSNLYNIEVICDNCGKTDSFWKHSFELDYSISKLIFENNWFINRDVSCESNGSALILCPSCKKLRKLSTIYATSKYDLIKFLEEKKLEGYIQTGIIYSRYNGGEWFVEIQKYPCTIGEFKKEYHYNSITEFRYVDLK